MDHIINPIVTQSFHNGSAKLSMLSIFANQKNKFWEMNDALFEIPKLKENIKLRTLSEKTGLSFEELKSIFRKGELWELLRNDIEAGLKYGVTGTPGFVINNDVYLGKIPAEILKKYVKN
jgi:protein-disulfide isomerase